MPIVVQVNSFLVMNNVSITKHRDIKLKPKVNPSTVKHNTLSINIRLSALLLFKYYRII